MEFVINGRMSMGNISTNNSKHIFYFPCMGLATDHAGKVKKLWIA
jgi:hypothetical protein